MKLGDDDKPFTPQQARQKLHTGLSDYLAGKSSETIVFRLKRTKKASEAYPLKLTRQQRETLLRCSSLSRNLKKKIKQAGEGTQVVGVTWNELHKLNHETGKIVYAPKADKKRLTAIQRKVVKFIEEEHAEIFDFEAPITKKPNPKVLYQFTITLLESHPPIWRRIQVKDCTLDNLHEHIQTAMGWTNSHLNQFKIGEWLYGDPLLIEDNFVEFGYQNSTTTLLSEIIPTSGKRFSFLYEYDFGDGWEHEVLFEGCPKVEAGRQYPICLEGERACPPEDVGGIGGFEEFLEIIANPKHEEHEGMMRWAGGWFDPEAFDVNEATKDMKKGLPDWRKEEGI